MSRRDDRTSLEHMLNHAEEAIERARGRTRADLESDRTLELCLVRLCEVVGEAAARVGQTTRSTNPNIAWKQIVGLRNRLIHGYDEVDFDVLWGIVQNDLPVLVAELRRMRQAGGQ